MSELKIGMTVWIRLIGDEARNKSGDELIKRGRVTKVGRKWFYVAQDGWDDALARRVSIETKLDDQGEYVSDWKVYLNEQKLMDRMELENLRSGMRVFFNDSGRNLSLDQLRRIKCILEED